MQQKVTDREADLSSLLSSNWDQKKGDNKTELWSFLSTSDGEHCPQFTTCKLKTDAHKLCIDVHRALFLRVITNKRLTPIVRQFRTCPKRSEERIGRIYAAVRDLADELLAKGAVCRLPVPNEIALLADPDCSIEIREIPLKKIVGALWRTHDGWIIHLNSNRSVPERRFTLFHEVFHIIAHCNSSVTFKRMGLSEAFFNEHLAEYFASNLLMPLGSLAENWKRIDDLQKMEDLFIVPKQFIHRRLIFHGLITMCLLAFLVLVGPEAEMLVQLPPLSF